MRAVAGRGRMTPAGYRPENHEHIDVLTTVDGARRIGRDPGTVSLDALSAAGHPASAAGSRAIVARMNEYGGHGDSATGVRLTGLRERYCYRCRPSEGFSDAPNHRGIRECATIDCPVWPYRLGFNPQNPRRGKDPFEESRHG